VAGRQQQVAGTAAAAAVNSSSSRSSGGKAAAAVAAVVAATAEASSRNRSPFFSDFEASRRCGDGRHTYPHPPWPSLGLRPSDGQRSPRPWRAAGHGGQPDHPPPDARCHVEKSPPSHISRIDLRGSYISRIDLRGSSSL